MEGRPLGGGSRANAGDPWRRIAPGHRWSELVIPEPQREALRTTTAQLSASGGEGDNAETRASGSVLLFSGPAGTGKTMAARIVGAELQTPVLEVDTTALRARDRAGLEALVGRVFRTASAESAILFFDHADTILGERPARGARHGRPGELAAADLFERAERHPAPVIFASTLSGKIDAAYRCHFSSVIEFPFPDADARERIWRQLLPQNTSLTAADIKDLSSSFQLPGAAIATCCVVAVQTAKRRGGPVGLVEVAAAVAEEYRGRLASDATLAAVAALVGRARRADSKPAVSQRGRGRGPSVSQRGRGRGPSVSQRGPGRWPSVSQGAGRGPSGSRPNGGSAPPNSKRSGQTEANGSAATH
ncbi:MAG: AAA family ATPase, partial [Solirubrobacteraceae bacterium]